MYDAIRKNEIILSKLDAKQYPALHKYLFRSNSTLRQHLYNLWYTIADHKTCAERDRNGVEYHTVTISYLVETYGGSLQSWQSHSVFLRDTGLIGGRKPDKFTKLSEMKKAFERAQDEEREAVIFFYFVPLKDEVLAEAERVAQEYASRKQGISHISKTDVILARGQKKANGIYKDHRDIPAEEAETIYSICSIIAYQIGANGYTTKDEVLAEAERLPYGYYVQKWKRRFNELCERAEAEQHPPRKKDTERFALKSRKWIVTAKRAEA